MKKTIIIAALLSIAFFSCKKSSTDGGSSTGTAKVTFTNSFGSSLRLLLTSTADTVYPFNNYIFDVDVVAGGSVTRLDVPAGKRKMVGFIVCTAGQPINLACTTYVYKTVEYLANQTYTQPIKQ